MAQGSSPSRIPTPVNNLRRSASVRVRGERPLILYSTSPSPFPSISEKEEAQHISTWTTPRKNLGFRSRSQASGLNTRDDDTDSVESFGSNISAFSRASLRSNCDCEHSLFAKNGTTYSARSNKFVVHCSGHCGAPDEYLTPTQRANRNVRRLKTLLQLAKEKLVEKDAEIFKLTKEVVELKVYKASMNNFSETSTPSDVPSDDHIDCIPTADDTLPQMVCNEMEKLHLNDTHASPKVSPRGKTVSPWDQRDTLSATPDYLLSSLADSGQFDVDDLASSLSVQSKDSFHLQVLPDDATDCASSSDLRDKSEELVGTYEVLLKNVKEAHENEIKVVKEAHDAELLQMVDCFDKKLKDTEDCFEKEIQQLLKNTEEEKVKIVERFELQLEKTRLECMANNASSKAVNGSQTDGWDLDNEEYSRRVDEQKAIYEKSLCEIKAQFKIEREEIEKNFDVVMAAERDKFETAVATIQADYDVKLLSISGKTSHTEKRYNELLEKYERSLLQISKLEEGNKLLQHSIEEQDERQKDLYLKMFLKGQEAAKLQEDEKAGGCSTQLSPSVLAPELLVQLKVTQVELENLKDKEYRAQHRDDNGISLISAKEALSLWMLAARKAMYKRLSETQHQSSVRAAEVASGSSSSGGDPQATLQFLKSAVYYFLTDRDNHLQHLRAIENILGFSSSERKDIESRYVQ